MAIYIAIYSYIYPLYPLPGGMPHPGPPQKVNKNNVQDVAIKEYKKQRSGYAAQQKSQKCPMNGKNERRMSQTNVQRMSQIS